MDSYINWDFMHKTNLMTVSAVYFPQNNPQPVENFR